MSRAIEVIERERAREAEMLTEDLKRLERLVRESRSEPEGLRARLRTVLPEMMARHQAIAHAARPATPATLTAARDEIRTLRSEIESAVASHADALAIALFEPNRAIVLRQIHETLGRGVSLEDLAVLIIDTEQPDIPAHVAARAQGRAFIHVGPRHELEPVIRPMNVPAADALIRPAPRASCRAVVLTYGRAIVQQLDAVAVLSPGGTA